MQNREDCVTSIEKTAHLVLKGIQMRRYYFLLVNFRI